MDPAFAPSRRVEASQEAPLRIADRAALSPAAVLEPALAGARDEIAALTAWNRAGRLPTQNGFARPLARVIAPVFSSAAAATPGTLAEPAGDDLVWTTRVHVAGAYRLRLLLAGIRLPEGARLWVYSEDGETAGPFGRDLVSTEGALWTPSVAGPTVTLEARLPRTVAAQTRFSISHVMELFALGEAGEPRLAGSAASEGCLVQGRCVGAGTLGIIDDYRHAVAHLQFVEGYGAYICSGALVNDSDPSTFVPYLLTANHCFDSPASAASLDAFWDYYPASCGGGDPGLGGLAKSHGSTLLATGSSSDFTLVRLSSIPGGRYLLGWTTAPVPSNALLHRLSHPLGHQQSYSRTQAVSSPDGTCSGVPVSHFLYSNKQQGATFGGSSGAPLVLDSGHIVGQLFGVCAVSPGEPCFFSSIDYFVDGRFTQTYPSLAAFLNPTPQDGDCVRSPSTACLLDSRFEVTVEFENVQASGDAQVMSFNGQRSENDESVFLYFTSATNFEMGLKLLNGCALNGKFWVFIGGLTDQGWTVTLRDTQTGVTRTYSNPVGRLTTTVADTAAFDCP